MRTVARLIHAALRVFFRLLYHQLAWSYDLVAAVVSAGQWQNWVLSTLPYLTGPRVLELGFGPGYLQAALQTQPLLAVGIDESVQMGRLARRRLQRKGLALHLARALAQQLPFPGASFDQVVATFPAEYIGEPASLAELSRVLAPGGLLVVAIGAVNTGRSLPERLAAFIFRITLQAATANMSQELEARLAAPFTQAGFQATIERVTLKGSQVVLILARNS